jgi:rare lipoprotein A
LACGKLSDMKPSLKWLLLGVGVLLIARRASATTTPSLVQLPNGSNPPTGDVIEEGTASFYGGSFFQGKPTASGEPFDENKMTAAHRTLRFGTRLRVTDLDTGRTVNVVCNDRGPFARRDDGSFSRIIDLSSGAARAMGLDIQRGLARVRLERL